MTIMCLFEWLTVTLDHVRKDFTYFIGQSG